MKALRLSVALLLALAIPRLAAAQDLFELKPVVDGVYAAIAKPVYKINCNAVVIVIDDAVLVVDTHSKPSAARALMDQIQRTINKPVKYVVDTHFHWDHSQGNEAYPSAWPQGVEIISTDATREGIEQKGIPRVKNQILEVPKEIERLQAEVIRNTVVARRAELEGNLREAQSYLAELKAMKFALPTVTFDKSLVLHGKTRTVQILWLGKGHTDGDAFVYLPREKFLATGDSIHGWTPFMNDSYPYDWIKTLKAAQLLDFEYALGGHGDVMRGKAMFQMWEQYFTDLIGETTNAYAAGASITDAVRRVAAVLTPKYGTRMPASFPQDVVDNIQKVYRVVSGQMQ